MDRERQARVVDSFLDMFKNLDPAIVSGVLEAVNYDQEAALAKLGELSADSEPAPRAEVQPPPQPQHQQQAQWPQRPPAPSAHTPYHQQPRPDGAAPRQASPPPLHHPAGHAAPPAAAEALGGADPGWEELLSGQELTWHDGRRKAGRLWLQPGGSVRSTWLDDHGKWRCVGDGDLLWDTRQCSDGYRQLRRLRREDVPGTSTTRWAQIDPVATPAPSLHLERPMPPRRPAQQPQPPPAGPAKRPFQQPGAAQPRAQPQPVHQDPAPPPQQPQPQQPQQPQPRPVPPQQIPSPGPQQPAAAVPAAAAARAAPDGAGKEAAQQRGFLGWIGGMFGGGGGTQPPTAPTAHAEPRQRPEPRRGSAGAGSPQLPQGRREGDAAEADRGRAQATPSPSGASAGDDSRATASPRAISPAVRGPTPPPLPAYMESDLQRVSALERAQYYQLFAGTAGKGPEPREDFLRLLDSHSDASEGIASSEPAPWRSPPARHQQARSPVGLAESELLLEQFMEQLPAGSERPATMQPSPTAPPRASLSESAAAQPAEPIRAPAAAPTAQNEAASRQAGGADFDAMFDKFLQDQ